MLPGATEDDPQVKEIMRLRAELSKAGEKMMKMEASSHIMRKQYLKELILVKEAYKQGGTKINDALNVSFFDVTEGLDPALVEILNMRITDVAKNFSA